VRAVLKSCAASAPVLLGPRTPPSAAGAVYLPATGPHVCSWCSPGGAQGSFQHHKELKAAIGIKITAQVSTGLLGREAQRPLWGGSCVGAQH